MAEEQFFPIFTSRLREEVERLRKKRESSVSSVQSIYKKYWNVCDYCEESNYPIIACDGSLGSSPLSGGLTFWVARAVAHTYVNGTLLQATPEVGVKGDYMLEGESIFMKTVELRALRKATQAALKEHGKALAFYDGSLYFTFFHHRPHMEARKEILQDYVSELYSLLKLGLNDDVKILGVSKDSSITYLRTHIIFEELSKHNIDGLGYFRSIKWMRERMKREAPLDTDPIKDYLKEIENDESDEALYDKLMKEPGFTTPLLLAPQTCYVMQEVEEGHKRWSESHLRVASSESLKPLLEEMDKLYSLPPIALTYWKPKHGLRTYRLDVPSNLLGHKGKCEDLTGDEYVDLDVVNDMKGLVAKLNWLDKADYGIRPLIDVDEIARLIHRTYRRAYEPVILEELKEYGFDVKPRKRSIRDFFMRRV